MRILNDLVDICYPPLCVQCHNALSRASKKENNRLDGYLCAACHEQLPFWKEESADHLKERLLALAVGQKTSLPVRNKLVFVRACLVFEPENSTARLIHHLKYHRKIELGVVLGRLCAETLLSQENAAFDAIIPVPIHWMRRFSRGYNQSEYIAKGIEEMTGIPIQKALKRVTFNKSQARKARKERLQLADVFEKSKREEVRGKRVLLVDDRSNDRHHPMEVRPAPTCGRRGRDSRNGRLSNPESPMSGY